VPEVVPPELVVAPDVVPVPVVVPPVVPLLELVAVPEEVPVEDEEAPELEFVVPPLLPCVVPQIVNGARHWRPGLQVMLG
jgi:hypothetical protein